MSGERQGRAVLVTGASRGIGAAAAHAFAAQGDRIAVHFGRRADQAEAVAAALPGTGHAVVGADLADPEAVRGMVDGAAEALGGLDVLVNNAGVFVPHPITATTYEAWQRAWRDTLAVNLVGPATLLVRRAAPPAQRRRADRQRRLARGLPGGAGPARLRGEQGGAGRVGPVAGPGRSGSRSPRSPPGSPRPTWRRRRSPALRATPGGRRARWGASPRRPRSRRRSSTSPRPRPSWPAARCSTSTGPRTCASERRPSGGDPEGPRRPRRGARRTSAGSRAA